MIDNRGNKKENAQEKSFSKNSINWLITVYSNFWRNPLFIRLY